MADYTLHCFVESGNAYKVALMLELISADWQPVWVDFFNGGVRTPDYLALNELGEIPVLIDHTEDDLTLSQSGVILTHLARRSGQFGPANESEEREILRWLLWDNHKLTAQIATFRFLRKIAKKGDSPEAQFLKTRAFVALKILEKHLSEHDWIAAKRMTIADISCCGYLFWPDHFEADWQDFPAIAAWLERIKTQKGWKAPEDILPSQPV